MAIALNKSEKVLVSKNKSLANFTYDDSEMAQLFKNSLSEVAFRGFSVREIFFDIDLYKVGKAMVFVFRRIFLSP